MNIRFLKQALNPKELLRLRNLIDQSVKEGLSLEKLKHTIGMGKLYPRRETLCYNII